MIRISIEGAGGWLSVLLWCCMAVGVPAYCFFMGRAIGRDQVEERVEQAEHDAWIAEHHRRPRGTRLS